MDYRLISLKKINDERGQLIFGESSREIPFEIKRFYCIIDAPANSRRGFHAHKNLKQCLICLKGNCDIIIDDGKNRRTISLAKPDDGLIIEGEVWRELHNFSHDCVLLVLADEFYDPDDYIHDYPEFIRRKNGKK